MADLSRLSSDDLRAIAAGDMSAVSDYGLKVISGEQQPGQSQPDFAKSLYQSVVHNVQKPFHSVANIAEQGIAGLALAAAPEGDIAQWLGKTAMSDEEAQKKWEAEYQAATPDNAGSYLGATIGSIAPFMMSGAQQGLKLAGEAGGKIAQSVVPKFAEKLAGNVGNLATQGAVASGLTAPSLSDAPEAAGYGAAVGGVIPVIGAVGNAVSNIVIPGVSKIAAERGAAKQLIEVSGEDAKAVAQRLIAGVPENQSQIETAAQRLVDLNNPKISALQKYWQSNYGSVSAYRNELAQKDLEVARLKFLGAETAPQRQEAIDEANRVTRAFNIAKAKGTSYQEEAANLVAKVRNMENLGASAAEQAIMLDSASQAGSIAAGMPRVGGQNVSRAKELIDVAQRQSTQFAEQSLRAGASARLAEGIVGSMEQRGLKPISADDFISSINSIANQPENIVNDSLRLLSRRVVNAVQRAAQANNGMLDAASLDALRRTAINDFIESASRGNPTQAKKLASHETTTSFKQFIDNAIENAGGAGYKDYMLQYSNARREIEAPLLRMEQSDEMAQKGMQEIVKIMNNEKIHGLGVLERAVTISQALLRGIKGIAGKKVAQTGAELMTNEPQKMGMLMQQEFQRGNRLNKLYPVVPGAISGSQGMLTGQQQ